MAADHMNTHFVMDLNNGKKNCDVNDAYHYVKNLRTIGIRLYHRSAISAFIYHIGLV